MVEWNILMVIEGRRERTTRLNTTSASHARLFSFCITSAGISHHCRQNHTATLWACKNTLKEWPHTEGMSGILDIDHIATLLYALIEHNLVKSNMQSHCSYEALERHRILKKMLFKLVHAVECEWCPSQCIPVQQCRTRKVDSQAWLSSQLCFLQCQSHHNPILAILLWAAYRSTKLDKISGMHWI